MKKRAILFIVLAVVVSVFFACSPKEKLNPKFQLKVQVQGQGKIYPSSGLYELGSTIEFDIEPSEGWLFSSWAGESLGDMQEAEGNWKILMNGNKQLTAIFVEMEKVKEYSLNVTVKGRGTVEPNSGKFEEGSIVMFDIKAETGWAFKEWEGKNRRDLQEIEGNWQVTMDSSKTIEAVFTEVHEAIYSLEVTVNGSGTIVKSPNEELYEPSTLVTLQAIPHTGWYFVQWSGDATSNSDELKITMDGNKSLVAEFAAKEYSLLINIEGQGEVLVENKTSALGTYPHNTELILLALPNEGWLFKEWRGALTSKKQTESLLMNSEKEVTAVFTKMNFNLDIEIIGEGQVVEAIVDQTRPEYPYGTLVRLEAIPAEGWEFGSWSGDISGQEPLAQILLDGHKKVTANFTEIAYFELQIVIDGQGTVTQTPLKDKYMEGSLVTLTANPAANWFFKGWSGAVSDTKEEIEVLMDSKKTITASFEKMNYTLAIDVQGEGSVEQELISSRHREYPYEAIVRLTATPAAGWQFFEWQGDASGTETSVEIEMDSSKAVTAVFKEISRYTLDITTEGQGSVTCEPDQNEFYAGETVKLTALADTGWEFKEWSGDASGTSEVLEILMDDDKTVTATFTAIPSYSLTVAVQGQGQYTMEPAGGLYLEGTPVYLEATAAHGWSFQSWTGDLECNEPGLSLVMDDDKALTLTFVRVKHTLNIETTGDGYVEKGLIDYPLGVDYPYGTKIQLRAKANAGSRFLRWEGDASGTASQIIVEMDGDKTVIAVFEEISCYTLTINIAGGGSCTRTPDLPKYLEGTEVTLVPVPDTGWEFAGWVDLFAPGDGTRQVTMDDDKNLELLFARKEYDLNISIAGNGRVVDENGKEVNSGKYLFEDGLTLIAEADLGWEFIKWTGDYEDTVEKIFVIMDDHKSLEAVFEKIPRYILTVHVQGQGSYSQSPDQADYERDTIVNLTATADYGWEFDRWTGAFADTSGNASVIMDSDKEITVIFVEKNFLLTVLDPENGQIVDGDNNPIQSGEYPFATNLKLKANPDEGWRFKEWLGDLSGNGADADLIIDGDKTIGVVFEKIPTYTLTVRVINGITDWFELGVVIIEPKKDFYYEGEVVTLRANKKWLHGFKGWTGDYVGNEEEITITMDKDKTIRARFSFLGLSDGEGEELID